MKLRPHHLLCTQGYAGKGYSDGFVENMTAVTNRLRGDSDEVIEIIYSTDDICAECPKMLGTDLCETNDKIKLLDQKVIRYFGIEEKEYAYGSIVQEINSKMTASILDDICGDCSWYPISNCKKNIIGEK